MFFKKTALILSVSVLSLAVTQPAAATEGGLVSGLTGTVNGITQGLTGTASVNNTLDGALKAADNSLKVAGASSGLLKTGGNGGLLARATGGLDSSGQVKSLNLFGDDMVRIDLSENAAAARAGAEHGARVDTRRLALTEGDAQALLSRAVNLEGVPQARSLKVGSDGSIILGATADDDGASAKVKAKQSASAKTDAEAMKADAKKTAQKAKAALPMTAEADRDEVRLASRLPRGGNAEAEVSR